jgi:hypothetical protein
LTATKISADLCGLPNPDSGKILEIIPPACGGIATLVLVLRFTGKFLSRLSLRPEDYFALGSWASILFWKTQYQKLTAVFSGNVNGWLFHRH